MCGINLIIDKKGNLPEAAIRRMTLATHHRGPDATAYHKSRAGKAHLYFGHNRLKIIDPSDAANQPFISADGRYVLLYNGEIYNYAALKKNLQLRGCVFRTQSDTEVVLQVLMRDGQQGLAQLNGMFALAFYDTQEQQLLLARDRFGIKPLFYAQTENYFIVSSQIQGILQSGLIPKKLNQGQVYHYLKFKHAAKPQTFYQHISELPEGTALYWEKAEFRLCSYADNQPPQYKPGNTLPVAQHLETLLSASIQQHLIADVPVGLFLSGGIDSTLLLALLHRMGYRHFPAFTIAQPAAAGSFGTADAHFASLAARQYEAEHTCFEINETILAGTDAWVQALDQPIADSAGLLTSYLSQKVKPYLKVALSGAGADELFGGYNRHRAFYLYQKRQHLALACQKLSPLMALLPTGFDHPLRKSFLLFRKLAFKIKKNPGKTFLNFTTMDQALADLWKLDITDALGTTDMPDQPQDWLRWILQHDQHHYLISDVLAVTDQASMQHSLEIRTPYLENNLVAFLSGLDSKTIFKGGQKWLLKEVLAAKNGQAFFRRSKEGFGLPLGNWLRNAHNQYLFKELQTPQQPVFEFINFTQTQKLLQSHRHQRHDYSSEIWALIVLAKWLQHNFS